MADDHVTSSRSPRRKNRKSKEKQTTRFYALKYIESHMNEGEHFPSAAPYLKSPCLMNPKEYFRVVYGPMLCSLLLTSVVATLAGSALMLAGYYVPRLSANNVLLHQHIGKEEAISKAQQNDDTLKKLRIAGIVLLSVGGVGMTVLILTPIIFLRRTEYTTIPTDDKPKSPMCIYPPMSRRSQRTPDSIHCSTVKNQIQPSRKQPRNSKRGDYHCQRGSYDKGFLSPDLNRGPIFISDATCRISDHQLSGSSSFSLPESLGENNRETKSNIPPETNLTRTPIKAGKFHSLQ